MHERTRTAPFGRTRICPTTTHATNLLATFAINPDTLCTLPPQRPMHAKFEEICRFHSDEYTSFLKVITPENMAEHAKQLQRCTSRWRGGYWGDAFLRVPFAMHATPATHMLLVLMLPLPDWACQRQWHLVPRTACSCLACALHLLTHLRWSRLDHCTAQSTWARTAPSSTACTSSSKSRQAARSAAR